MKYIFQISSRTDLNQSAEEKHNLLIQSMRLTAAPWGLEQNHHNNIPEVNFGKEFTAIISLSKFFKKSIKCTLFYRYRNRLEDHHSSDDRIYFEFNAKKIDYRDLLNNIFPKYVLDFKGYKAEIFPEELIYLDFEKSRNINLRQKLIRFYPVMYMDNELCKRAVGKTAPQVVELLKNVDARVELVNNGVLIIATSTVSAIDGCNELDKKMRSYFLIDESQQ